MNTAVHDGPVVTLGEAMLRLTAPRQQRLEQVTRFDVTVGGAELNVAAGLSRLGRPSRWVSALPDSPLGRLVDNHARAIGVDTRHVVWASDARLGLYFLEQGASPRASTVLYDRADSAFARLATNAFDWTSILAGVRAFHVSGITPALGAQCATQTRLALQAARKAACLVSYDLNYRTRLWSAEDARKVQAPLMNNVDVLITTEEDAERVFGVRGSSYQDVARQLVDQYEFKVVAITIRENISVMHNRWTAIALSDGIDYDDRTYDIEVVDRLGGGDAFAAGFLFGLLAKDIATGLRYGNALSALKQTVPGDLAWVTLSEVESQLSGASLRIAR